MTVTNADRAKMAAQAQVRWRLMVSKDIRLPDGFGGGFSCKILGEVSLCEQGRQGRNGEENEVEKADVELGNYLGRTLRKKQERGCAEHQKNQKTLVDGGQAAYPFPQMECNGHQDEPRDSQYSHRGESETGHVPERKVDAQDDKGGIPVRFFMTGALSSFRWPAVAIRRWKVRSIT